MSILLLFALFQFKHFVIDFVFQPPYEWKNKGTYGHVGGVLHSFKHAAGTALILCVALRFPSFRAFGLIEGLVLIDFFAHYHIDWAKMNINALYNLTPNDEKFWMLLGLDQLLHQLTMIAIVGIFIGLK